MPAVEKLICATLRGERPRWPEEHDEEFIARFVERSGYHGVQPLIHKMLQAANDLELGWPSKVKNICRNAALGQAIWEMGHRIVLKDALAELSEKGVQPLLFKGSALAYSIYASPSLRTRGDSDFLIPLCARDQTSHILESLDFECEIGVKGDLINSTAVYFRRAPNLGEHQLDVHWRISNAAALSRLFSYEELRSEARQLSALSPHALAIGPVHALLIACMHKAGHRHAPYYVNRVEYYGGDRLIWLYDVHLLLSRLRPPECEQLIKLARQKGLQKLCLEQIDEAKACLHTIVPETLSEGLAFSGPSSVPSRYLSGSVVDQYWLNFLAAKGGWNKLRFVSQLLFPPKKYMRKIYSDVKPSWLPWLYLRRAVIESFKRLRRVFGL